MQELGWRSSPAGDVVQFSGQFRLAGLRYDGYVRQELGGRLSFYIHNPPIVWLRETEYGGCFHPRDDGWWLVSFKPHEVPADASSGVAAIQIALVAAFATRTRKRRLRA